VFLIPENGPWSLPGGLPSHVAQDESTSESNFELRPSPKSLVLVIISSLSAIAALSTPYASSPTSVLGLCSALFLATGLVLYEGAIRCRKEEGHVSRRGFMSANGSFSRFSSAEKAPQDGPLAALRDVAGVMTFVCGAATYIMEPMRSDTITWAPQFQMLDGDWKADQYPQLVRQCLFMIIINVVKNFSLFIMVCLQWFHLLDLFKQLFINSFLTLALEICSAFGFVWGLIATRSACGANNHCLAAPPGGTDYLLAACFFFYICSIAQGPLVLEPLVCSLVCDNRSSLTHISFHR
jgi:hypothetical protein